MGKPSNNPPSNSGQGHGSGHRGTSDSKNWSKIAPYATLSCGGFTCFLILLYTMLWHAQMLVDLGLVEKLYYAVLVPLSLGAAAFLFGALKSYAVYQGKGLGGAVELGGPIVGAALVVIGGFWLTSPPKDFSLTVYLHGQGGVQDLVLRNAGRLMLDLGPDRRNEAINEKGQVFFPGIPASFRGQEVNVFLDADGFELVNLGKKCRLKGSSLYLPVHKKAGRVTGHVQDEEGNPVTGASVAVAGLTAATDTTGRFDLAIAAELMQDELSLQIVASGFATWRSSVTPNANEITVILRHRP